MGEKNKKFNNKKYDLHIHFTDFDLPPVQDVLLIGKRAPIGPEAVRRMVDALVPGKYEVITINDNNHHIEAIAIKSSLFNWMSRDKLVNTILEEAISITDENSLVKAELDIKLSIHKEVEF